MGVTPSHVYQRGALYSVALLVTDGVATSRASTTATIADAFPARAYAPEGRKKLRLAAGTPTLCVQIEPVGSLFDIRDVDLGSIHLKLADLGSTADITAIGGKTRVVSDRDENGVEEIGACFDADEIRRELAGRQGAPSSVTVELEGTVLSGGKFRAPLELEIFARGGPGHASVSPNPLNPVGLLSFSTSKPGHIRVAVYDPGGRLVRLQYEELVGPAGDHEVTLDGRASNGQALGSGVYFYRLETVDGSSTGRFVILK